MKRTRFYSLFMLACVASLQACVSGPTLEMEHQRGMEADKALHDKNWPQAQIAFKAYIEGTGFSHLPQDTQYAALREAAFVGLYHGDKALGYAYLRRSVDMPGADAQQWIQLLDIAVWLDHDADAVFALVTLAQRFPEPLAQVDGKVVSDGLKVLSKLPADAQFDALTKLYAANFKLKWGAEPSQSWSTLTLLLLERKKDPQAVEVTGRITDSTVLMRMRIDRRFDAVVAANPGRFDVEAAAHAQLRVAQDLSDQHPELLALKLQVIFAMWQVLDYEVMLAASDELVSEIESTNYPRKLFTDADYDSQYRMLLELRSKALERIGKTEEAVEQLRVASRLTENGGRNVSQAIDLGDLYCRVHRPNDALAAVAEVGSLSPFGAMLREGVRLEAAVQLNDAAQIEKSLAYMQAHRVDEPGTLEREWVLTSHTDLAAQSLIGRLLDPAQRGDALRSVQIYGPIPELEWETRFDAQWRELIARPDVQAAINKVGRIESFRLEQLD